MDGRLLAVKLTDEQGYWYTLPGGGQHVGETLVDTLRRECLEEIGAKVEVGELRFVREYRCRLHEHGKQFPDEHIMEFMFLCRFAEGETVGNGAAPDSDQVGVVWLNVDELDNYRLYPLALRPLIARCAQWDSPVYLGDIG
jgi:8-oxo-dGTP pyrophosphatase MutT (NUDIX family)